MRLGAFDVDMCGRPKGSLPLSNGRRSDIGDMAEQRPKEVHCVSGIGFNRVRG
jgi:hypothetical protein